jgi:hypothetical protein
VNLNIRWFLIIINTSQQEIQVTVFESLLETCYWYMGSLLELRPILAERRATVQLMPMFKLGVAVYAPSS